MDRVHLTLLRGICQLPGYVAVEAGLFREQGLDVKIEIAPTAWMVPEILADDMSRFAVIPWTRVAADPTRNLTVVCGSGVEEAAIVVKPGLSMADVKTVALPVAGGMKDLTALALLDDLGWQHATLLRQPSGDGAIIALFGRGADAASMVEPYATMLEALGAGKVVRRTGDIWPGAPGCSVTCSARLVREQPDLVRRMVRAYVRGARFVSDHAEEAGRIGSRYIGVQAEYIRDALRVNRPDPQAIHHQDAMTRVLALMRRLGYLHHKPDGYCAHQFLDEAGAATG
jgi:ABC-type nitrate/sulfonate/bicarbonate transport system substrate-binding protein